MKYTLYILLSLFLFGFNYPETKKNLIQVDETGYSIGYSKEIEQPLWVCWELTSNMVCQTNKVKRTNDFRQNVISNILTSATPEEYKNSGYDRGHMCPAGDRTYSKKLMSETFLMSNMCPQHPDLNRKTWMELEHDTRINASTNEILHIYCGPVFFGKTNYITNSLAIPNMFYKVIVNKMTGKIDSYLFPNDKCNGRFNDYIVPLHYIETLSGIKFNLN